MRCPTLNSKCTRYTCILSVGPTPNALLRIANCPTPYSQVSCSKCRTLYSRLSYSKCPTPSSRASYSECSTLYSCVSYFTYPNLHSWVSYSKSPTQYKCALLCIDIIQGLASHKNPTPVSALTSTQLVSKKRLYNKIQ